ncbi:MAG: MATE family efflux transporter, partial [Clostridia bacterium]|nr:MATE family efflux transporter [Clostridia bacterium]
FSTIVSMTFMALFSVVGFLLSGELIALFRDEAHVIEIGTKALRAQLCVFPLMGWVFLSNMMLQTIGRVFKASILAAARQGLAFLPVVLILPDIFGLGGLVWAQAVADVLAFLIALPIQISVLREMEGYMKESVQI